MTVAFRSPSPERVRLAVRRRASRVGRKVLARAGYAPVPNGPAIQAGMVERFSKDRVNGWVAVEPGSRPVRIALQLNGRDIVATWAVDVAGRTSSAETRSFRFWLDDIWTYVRPRDKLVVRAGDAILPIYHVGTHLSPRTRGSSNPAALREQMERGWIFGQFGGLQLSKKLDTAWQQQVTGLFDAVRTLLSRSFGYEPFFIYGTLLGAVREGGFIGHDVDFDCAYISRHTDGGAAGAELRDVAFGLLDAGYVVECFRTHLHVTDPAGTRIDIFHLYWDTADELAFPFGVAGTTVLRRSDWHGLEEIDFSGGRGIVPANAEQFVEHMYGATWRDPKPGFNWRQDRTSRAPDGVLADDLVEEIYWANFYAHTEFDTGSTFCELVLARDDIPRTVLDIGCGDGRDSFAFGRAGRAVTGLDRSHVGVAHAAKKAAQLGLEASVGFATCDVGHATELRSVLTEAIERADGPVLVYLRFFLHSIPEDVQETLLSVLGEVVRPGDALAAEFRTTEDEQEHKVHTRHFRRFQDGPAFGARLRDEFGYTLLLEQQGRGLSVYGDEDPALYRVLARRSLS